MSVDTAECPICFEVKPLASLKPCNHAVCPRCIHTLLHRTAKCPMCRSIFSSSSPPLVVFNTDWNPNILCVKMERNKKTKLFGIGVSQENNDVVVTSVEKYNKSKIKKNQSIIAINNLPCYHKKPFIESLTSDACQPHFIFLQKNKQNPQ